MRVPSQLETGLDGLIQLALAQETHLIQHLEVAIMHAQ